MWGICSLEPYRGSNLYRRRITAGRLLQPGAPIIENFTLVQQTRLRAQAPKRCAGFAKPGDIAATLDEILNSLKEMAHLLKADVRLLFSFIRSRIDSTSPFSLCKAEALSDRAASCSLTIRVSFTMAGSQHSLLLNRKNNR